jgi:hypothetical protein
VELLNSIIQDYTMSPLYQFLLRRHIRNREEFSRGQLLINFSLVEIAIGATYYAIHPIYGFHAPRNLYLLFCVTVAGVILFLKSRLSLAAIGNLMIFVLWANFCVAISYSGGIYSQIIPWLAVTTVFANLLASQKAALFWAGISICSVLFFTFFFANTSPLQEPDGNLRGLASHVGVVVIIYLFTQLFHQSQTDLVKKIKRKNRKLKESRKLLLESNREIESQKSFIEKQNKLLRQQNKSIDAVNKLLERRVEEIMSSNKKLEGHWQTLLSITKSYIVNFGQLEEALSYIAETAANSLKINRVSVWRYHKKDHKLVCSYLYNAMDHGVRQEDALNLQVFPNYFKHLLKENVIVANRAQTDLATSELTGPYLKLRSIVSMMDTPFFLGGELAGVLCCEHTNEIAWANEDILFVQALSDIVTISIMADMRRRDEKKLIEKQAEIIQINASLEERVKARTIELEKQNNQLAEYAYINSHLLRAPLSRLLGLVNLLRYSDVSGAERELIISYIQHAGEELDLVVAKINKALGFENPFNREIFSSKDH